jgi:hypothetical protein
MSGLDCLACALDCLICATFARERVPGDAGPRKRGRQRALTVLCVALTVLYGALTVLYIALTFLYVQRPLSSAQFEQKVTRRGKPEAHGAPKVS